MGNPYFINNDGSVTQSTVKTINNIAWIDYAQYKGKVSAIQVILHILFLFPIFGWGAWVISWCGVRISRGYWPFFGIRAIENTDDSIKIYCNKEGKLGLYTKKHRITSAKFDSIQSLPTEDYPAFVVWLNNQCCIYNYTQGQYLFKGSQKITYLGDNTVLVEQKGKSSKYSLIGMCMD